MGRILVLVSLIICLAGCAAAKYKKADLGFYMGQVGYLDKQIDTNTYILEYSHIGGNNYNLGLNKSYWEKRANQLCPSGYEGGYEVIHPAHAKIKEFECALRFCSKYPLVSGVIKCK